MQNHEEYLVYWPVLCGLLWNTSDSGDLWKDYLTLTVENWLPNEEGTLNQGTFSKDSALCCFSISQYLALLLCACEVSSSYPSGKLAIFCEVFSFILRLFRQQKPNYFLKIPRRPLLPYPSELIIHIQRFTSRVLYIITLLVLSSVFISTSWVQNHTNINAFDVGLEVFHTDVPVDY